MVKITEDYLDFRSNYDASYNYCSNIYEEYRGNNDAYCMFLNGCKYPVVLKDVGCVRIYEYEFRPSIMTYEKAIELKKELEQLTIEGKKIDVFITHTHDAYRHMMNHITCYKMNFGD